MPIDRAPDPVIVYQIAVCVTAAAMIVACWMAYSPFGTRLKAVRDDEGAAISLGVSAFGYQLTTLVVSGALSGVTGALIALQQLSFEPAGMLGITWTMDALLMTIVGGLATVVGPLVGAAAVYFLLTKQLEQHPTVSLVVQGLLLIVVVRFAPRGLWPMLLDLLAGLRRTRASGDARSAAPTVDPESSPAGRADT